MKLSTRKIFGLELVLTLTMFVLALLPLSSVLREYLQVATFVAALATSLLMFSWAKPRSRDIKVITIAVLLTIVAFEALYWTLLGIKCGFVTNIYGWNWLSLVQVFIPVAMLLILTEVLRGQMVERGKGSKFIIIFTGISFTLIEILLILPTYRLNAARGWFDLSIITIIPAIMNNLLLTYIAYTYDYRINIAYQLLTNLPFYLMPLLPDVNQYLRVLFQTVLVIILALGLISWQKLNGNKRAAAALAKLREPKRRPLTQQQIKLRKSLRYGATGLVGLLMVIYAALMSGLFKYHFLAIGSGSMEPNLYRGDMILVQKSQAYDQITEGDVLVYRHSNATIVHRVSAIDHRDQKYYYKTQGDANPSEDAWEVEQGDVIGIAKGKIIAFGFPTLWLNELFNGGKI